jgi:signal transduction histidine kinase
VNRIATRFAVLLALAAVLPLLAYGALSITSLQASAQETVTQGNLGVARRAAEEIEQYVTGSVRIFSAVAADLQQTDLEAWQQERILRNYVLQFPEFSELTLVDGNGTAVVSSRLVPPTVTIPGADATVIAGALLSAFSIDDDLLPTAVVASQPSGRGGWLVGRLQLEQLWRMVDNIRIGNQGYALVVTDAGRLLAHGDPDEKSRVARGDDLSAHPLLTAAESQAASSTAPSNTPASSAPDAPAGRTADYDGARGPALGAAVRIPTLGWTVMVEQPRAEAFAGPLRTRQQLGVAIGLALLAMLGTGYYWGRSFIAPILRLMRGTRALAEGRLGERVRVESKDELGQLGVAFNNMADRLVELQADVRKQERQATFGRVAAGLVHDLAHPIQNIGNSCSLILKAYDDDEYRASFQRTIEREFEQVKRVLGELRDIARPSQLTRTRLDLNDVIRGTVESMGTAAASAGPALKADLSEEPLPIDGDLFALNRVFRNLTVNAFQATDPGGTVVVRTRRRLQHALVEVTDTGSGIPADRLDTIFDGATTKMHGLGLGLVICKRIVEELGGTISVSSTVGIGTTFAVRLPLTRSGPATDSRPDRIAAARSVEAGP